MKRHRHGTSILMTAVILLALTSSQNSARAQETRAEPLHPKDFWDKLGSEVPVSSSGVVRGLQAAGEPRLLPENVHVCIPAERVDELVLEITSIDGEYKAEASFDLAGLDAGVYRLGLDLEPRKKRFLHKQDPAHVAYLAYLPTAVGKRTIGKLLPVQSQATTGEADRYEVKLQSKATKTSVRWPGGSLPCHKLELDRAGAPAIRSFNSVCPFLYGASSELLDAHVIRQKFRDYWPRVRLPVQACP